MKFLICLLCLIGSNVYAGSYPEDQYTSNDLVCVKTFESKAVSCVSKVSIEKDKAELELIRVQVQTSKNQSDKEKAEAEYIKLQIERLKADREKEEFSLELMKLQVENLKASGRPGKKSGKLGESIKKH